MLDPKLLEELGAFKDFEEAEVKDKYKIKFVYLNLGLVIKYSKELQSVGSTDQKNMMAFITQFDSLADDVIIITKPDGTIVKLNTLPLAVAIRLTKEWIELNFTNGEKNLVQPIEDLLSKLTGKPINLRTLLSSLSQLLSVAGTAPKVVS